MVLPEKRLMLPEVYTTRSAFQFQRLAFAFEKLKSDNPLVSLETSPTELKLRVMDESFDLKLDPKRQTIWLTVPNDGTFEYYYDEQNERWIGWSDGHMLDELLSRSLLSKVQGYLDL